MLKEQEIVKRLDQASQGLDVPTAELFRLLKGEISKAGWISINNLYAELLLLNEWDEVKEMIPKERWSEVLSDNVIRILFPRSLRGKYLAVREKLLMSNTII